MFAERPRSVSQKTFQLHPYDVNLSRVPAGHFNWQPVRVDLLVCPHAHDESLDESTRRTGSHHMSKCVYGVARGRAQEETTQSVVIVYVEFGGCRRDGRTWTDERHYSESDAPERRRNPMSRMSPHPCVSLNELYVETKILL